MVRNSSIRLLISHAVHQQLDVHHVDIKNAYLSAPIDEDVYVDQPYLYNVIGKEKMVCKLKKAMYGLKQAARCWKNFLDELLDSMSFFRFASDECVYSNPSCTMFVGAYVDDLLVASKSEKEIEEFKSNLKSKIRITGNGRLTRFLGIDVNWLPNGLELSQRQHIIELLEDHGMIDVNGVKTPVPTGTVFETPENDESCNIETYQSMVGSLMYSMQQK